MFVKWLEENSEVSSPNYRKREGRGGSRGQELSRSNPSTKFLFSYIQVKQSDFGLMGSGRTETTVRKIGIRIA